MSNKRNSGLATAKAMTPQELSERGRKGAIATNKKKLGDNWKPSLPTVEYKGIGFLGENDNDIECYVLSNGERVLSLRQTVKTITGMDNARLDSYLNPLDRCIEGKSAGQNKGISDDKSLMLNEKLVGQIIEFKSNSNFGDVSKGVRAEFFADICGAYVEAAYLGLLKTDRQKEIARKCAYLQKAFMKAGIIGWVDEITGHQNYRAKDELQIKMNAYIAEEIKSWEKTFPDEYYQALARLSGFKDWRS